MHKLSFACMKTKFSLVGDIILDCQCQCQRIVKKYHLTHPSADTDTDSPIFRTLSLMK